PKNLIH
ncbi:hypothetical protein TNIN_286851, partial [Trichonephila inaurata madagascariensis]